MDRYRIFDSNGNDLGELDRAAIEARVSAGTLDAESELELEGERVVLAEVFTFVRVQRPWGWIALLSALGLLPPWVVHLTLHGSVEQLGELSTWLALLTISLVHAFPFFMLIALAWRTLSDAEGFGDLVFLAIALGQAPATYLELCSNADPSTKRQNRTVFRVIFALIAGTSLALHVRIAWVARSADFIEGGILTLSFGMFGILLVVPLAFLVRLVVRAILPPQN